MDNTDLFTAALQLEYPWKVSKVEFLPDEENGEQMALHITISFVKGTKFVFYYEDGSQWVDESGNPIEKTAHDTVDRTWRHLNFFQYKTYIHARMPKVSDGEGHCPTVQAPWARKNSKGVAYRFICFLKCPLVVEKKAVKGFHEVELCSLDSLLFHNYNPD